MNLSIKTKIYSSFFLLVVLFVLMGVVTINTLYHYKKSNGFSDVVNPSLLKLGELNKMLDESRMYTTNWVFLQWNMEDKDALLKIHAGYPELQASLARLSSQWPEKNWVDSLQRVGTGFESLLLIEEKIMRSLTKSDDYNDRGLKMKAEQLLLDEVIPRTAVLKTSLNNIISFEQDIRNQEQATQMRSSMMLWNFILFMIIAIVCAGIFLAIYMTRTIITPINRIRHIVNDLGNGITSKIEGNTCTDEMGKMISSVNNLSQKLQATATFAGEIGKRNFNADFDPLSEDDTLGKALILMRDNLKQSDERLNEAQHIAHLGSWERDVKKDFVYLSDELFRIFDLDPSTYDNSFQSIMALVHPEDLLSVENAAKQYMSNHGSVVYECRIVTKRGITKNIFVQGKMVLDAQDTLIKSYGIVQDITERKAGEEKLASERRLFRIMIDNMPDQIFLKDTESRFLLCNMPVALSVGCASQDELVGKTDADFFSPEDAARFCRIEQELLQSGVPIVNDEEMYTR